MEYEFTTDWFSPHLILWNTLLTNLKPMKILEIGAFEGRATTFMIETIGKHVPVDIYCVDTWKGGVEHEGMDFEKVQKRFDINCELATQKVPHVARVLKLIGTSFQCLSKLAVDNHRDFDLVYVDGSHVASDVFFDAAMAFQLARVGGAIIFDDYGVQQAEDAEKAESKEMYEFPKIAIDAFTMAHANKLKPMDFKFSDGKRIDEDMLYQRYFWKIAP